MKKNLLFLLLFAFMLGSCNSYDQDVDLDNEYDEEEMDTRASSKANPKLYGNWKTASVNLTLEAGKNPAEGVDVEKTIKESFEKGLFEFKEETALIIEGINENAFNCDFYFSGRGIVVKQNKKTVFKSRVAVLSEDGKSLTFSIDLRKLKGDFYTLAGGKKAFKKAIVEVVLERVDGPEQPGEEVKPTEGQDKELVGSWSPYKTKVTVETSDKKVSKSLQKLIENTFRKSKVQFTDANQVTFTDVNGKALSAEFAYDGKNLVLKVADKNLELIVPAVLDKKGRLELTVDLTKLVTDYIDLSALIANKKLIPGLPIDFTKIVSEIAAPIVGGSVPTLQKVNLVLSLKKNK